MISKHLSVNPHPCVLLKFLFLFSIFVTCSMFVILFLSKVVQI